MRNVSVIIPLYNRAALIGDTLENMLAQSVSPGEIIVVDDGSTDNSAEVVKSFGKAVTLISQTNQGPGAARNAGLRASKGDYIQFMDSDDLASKNKLKVQYEALHNSEFDFAYCPWVRSKIQDRKIKFLDKILQAGPIPNSKSMMEWFLSGWSLVFQNCLFKRGILEKAGTYRTDLMPSEDSEYFVRILLAGAREVFTPECLVFYREHTLNKITSSGTTAIDRANDWTNFLSITGDLLSDTMENLNLSTRLAIVANIENHKSFCEQHNLRILKADSAYNDISIPFRNVALPVVRIYRGLKKRLSGSPDISIAFAAAMPQQKYFDMINEIGFTHT